MGGAGLFIVRVILHRCASWADLDRRYRIRLPSEYLQTYIQPFPLARTERLKTYKRTNVQTPNEQPSLANIRLLGEAERWMLYVSVI
jgi:hypothetical protein